MKKKILFIKNEKSYLPEINAYINYFNKSKEFEAYESSLIDDSINIDDIDIIWEFKGLGGYKNKNKIIIHEYASLSTGPFPKVKNKIKKYFNAKPNLRIFLNNIVNNEFNFNDGIDYCIRDMGIDEIFTTRYNSNKEYDYVYVGEISKKRKIDVFLQSFCRNQNGKLCLVGKIDDDIFKNYKDNPNIIFTGKVKYTEVPEIISRAIYGLNLIPNEYPYNLQTSTKLIEYLSVGLKVISTEYKWVNDFEKANNCSFYKIDMHNLDLSGSHEYKYISNFKSEDYLWNTIFEKSRIKEKLIELINNC